MKFNLVTGKTEGNDTRYISRKRTEQLCSSAEANTLDNSGRRAASTSEAIEPSSAPTRIQSILRSYDSLQ